MRFSSVSGSPIRQAQELGERIAALAAADCVFVWTLHDFAAPEARAVGASTWVRNLQSRFGLFDAAGVAKPPAQAVSQAFSIPHMAE